MTKLTRRLLAVFTLLLAFIPARSFAASHTWSGAVNGNWSNAGNWSAGGVPTLAETNTLTFPAGAARFTITSDIGALKVSAFTLSGGYTARGASTFTGQLNILQGAVQADLNNSLGSVTGITVVSNGASLILSSGISTSESLNLAGDGMNGQGALQISGGTVECFGNVLLTNSATVRVPNLAELQLKGSISGPGGLKKTGEGELHLAGLNANTFSGASFVNGGKLSLFKPASTRALGSVAVSNTATPRRGPKLTRCARRFPRWTLFFTSCNFARLSGLLLGVRAMPQFSYKARRKSGEVVQGVLDVADRAAALVQIERLGLFPVMVEGARGAGAAAGASAETKGRALMPASMKRKRQRRPKLQELATYTQQLANLLNSGMALTVALNSMTHLESKGIPADVSRMLKSEVMEGRSLSDAMAKQRIIFTDLYINMVRAGEQSGALVDVLRRLADHYNRFAEVQAKFKSALIYPAVVATVGIGIVIFFMTFMLPRFLTIFEGLKVPLPMATQILVGISHIFSSYWWLMILMVITLVLLFKRFKASAEGRRKIDGWKLSAPVIGKVFRLNMFGQFARTLSTLLINGVPVLTALKITEEIIPNVIIKEAIAKTRTGVTDGKTIAQPLAQSKIFPQLMIDLIKIGEETGDVPGALKNVAETYENELTLALRVMTNLIEPAMIIMMAMLVGFLLFSVLSAMFSITASINH